MSKSLSYLMASVLFSIKLDTMGPPQTILDKVGFVAIAIAMTLFMLMSLVTKD